MKTDPISRSVTVSKSVNRVYLTCENGVVEVYKNDKRVVKFAVEDFRDFLKKFV